MTWALKRQIFFLSIFGAMVIAVLIFFLYPFFNRPATCMDHRKNGLETGVDCGGKCALACLDQVDPLTILWSRSFKVVDGRYNAVTYVENDNINTAIRKIKYKFRFGDENNIYIGTREGETFIPPSGKFAIFEPAIDVGNAVPVYTTFQFTEVPVWEQVSADKVGQLFIRTTDIRLLNPDTEPKLFATLKNTSLYAIPEVTVVAIIYDKNGNAINASRTYIDSIPKESSVDVSFTWPEPLGGEAVVKEIIPMFNVFLPKLK